MKIYAYYDLEGNIQSLISVEAAEGAFAMRAPQPGQFVAEIEIEGLESKPEASDPEVLLQIAQSYKVSTPLPRLKLSKKTA
jgi:hypothetical protein